MKDPKWFGHAIDGRFEGVEGSGLMLGDFSDADLARAAERLLLCPGCGAPVTVGNAAATVVCGYCRGVLRIEARDSQLIRFPSPHLVLEWSEDERERARPAQLRLQQEHYFEDVNPYSYKQPPECVYRLRNVECQYASARSPFLQAFTDALDACRTSGGFLAQQRAVWWLAECVAMFFYVAHDMSRIRAVLETALDTVTDPGFRFLLVCSLSVWATRRGDIASAVVLLDQCDPCPPVLDLDTARRIAGAEIHLVREEYREVLDLLGEHHGDVVHDPSSAIIFAADRITALRGLGQVMRAETEWTLLGPTAEELGKIDLVQELVAENPHCIPYLTLWQDLLLEEGEFGPAERLGRVKSVEGTRAPVHSDTGRAPSTERTVSSQRSADVVTSVDVQLLLCRCCGGTLSIPSTGGLGTCPFCGASQLVAARQTIPNRVPAPELDALPEAEREAARKAMLFCEAADYDAQTNPYSYNNTPNGYEYLIYIKFNDPMGGALFLQGFLDAVSRCEAVGFTKEREQAVFWTAERMLSMNDEQITPACRRAVLETAYRVLRDPGYQGLIACSLAGRAYDDGDSAAGEAWLGLCDPAPALLNLDCELRLRRANICIRAGRYAEALTWVGERRGLTPEVDSFDLVFTDVRVTALECLGRGAEAEAQLGELLGRLDESQREFVRWAANRPDWEVFNRVWKRLEVEDEDHFEGWFRRLCRRLWKSAASPKPR